MYIWLSYCRALLGCCIILLYVCYYKDDAIMRAAYSLKNPSTTTSLGRRAIGGVCPLHARQGVICSVHCHTT